MGNSLGNAASQSNFSGQSGGSVGPFKPPGGGSSAGMLPLIMGALHSFGGAQGNSTKQLGQVTNAMYNPSNPLYQQLYGQNKQNIQQNEGNAISQAEGMNRKLSSMGRTPLFSPERNGELAFRTAVQDQGNSGVQAQGQTEQQLGTAANALHAGVLPAQQFQTNRNQGGYQDISSFLQGMHL